MSALLPYMNYTFLGSQGMKYKVKDAVLKKIKTKQKNPHAQK